MLALWTRLVVIITKPLSTKLSCSGFSFETALCIGKANLPISLHRGHRVAVAVALQVREK